MRMDLWSYSGLQLKLFLLLVGIQQLSAIQLSNFFPFGVSIGDDILPRNNDDGAGPISLYEPFNFFDRSPTSVYVRLTNCTIMLGACIAELILSLLG